MKRDVTPMPSVYPLANDDHERQRLRIQSEALLPLTRRMLSGAGVGPGARVLELGCGAGDLTTLLADLVGPDGEVVAVDRDPSQIAAATTRLRPSSVRAVTFVDVDVESFVPTGTFDAVVGRYVLMYLPSPEGILERAAGWLRPGGALAFLEMDFFRGVRSRAWPPASERTMRAIDFVGDVMLDAGIHPDMAVRLPSALSRYGRVDAVAAAPLGFGAASLALPLSAVRSVVPTARRLGRADADVHDADALIAEELTDRDEHTVTLQPLSVAAWVRV